MKQPNMDFHWALLSPKKPQTHCCLRVRHLANHLVARNHKDRNRQRWWEWMWWCWWCSGGQTFKINVQCWNYRVTLIYSAVLPIYCKSEPLLIQKAEVLSSGNQYDKDFPSFAYLFQIERLIQGTHFLAPKEMWWTMRQHTLGVKLKLTIEVQRPFKTLVSIKDYYRK